MRFAKRNYMAKGNKILVGLFTHKSQGNIEEHLNNHTRYQIDAEKRYIFVKISSNPHEGGIHGDNVLACWDHSSIQWYYSIQWLLEGTCTVEHVSHIHHIPTFFNGWLKIQHHEHPVDLVVSRYWHSKRLKISHHQTYIPYSRKLLTSQFLINDWSFFSASENIPY